MYTLSVELPAFTITDYTRSRSLAMTYIELSGLCLSQISQDTHLSRLRVDAKVGRCRVVTNDVIRQLIERNLCDRSKQINEGTE